MTQAFSPDLDLTGKLLIAMPGMGDPRFEHSVVYMCAHSDEGAMGLIINKPATEVALKDVLDQLSIKPEDALGQRAVHFGGPVEMARGFVLHSSDYASRLQTLKVDEAFSMSATVDILEDIASGDGPEDALIMLGYSGWGPGQLEGEIGSNGWLTAEASPNLVFKSDDNDKWMRALTDLGVDPVSLSTTAGRA
jgi:putative transcriptional regulator